MPEPFFAEEVAVPELLELPRREVVILHRNRRQLCSVVPGLDDRRTLAREHTQRPAVHRVMRQHDQKIGAGGSRVYKGGTNRRPGYRVERQGEFLPQQFGQLVGVSHRPHRNGELHIGQYSLHVQAGNKGSTASKCQDLQQPIVGV